MFSLPPRSAASPEVLLRAQRGKLRLLAVDACSGAVLGALSGDSPTWVDAVARFHSSFALGSFGHWLAAAVGVTLAYLALSGVWLFLCGPRPFHAWLGIASALLLLLYAVSGLGFLFWRAPSPLRPVIHPSAAARASLDRLAHSALDAVPGSELSWIEFPASPAAPFAVRLRTRGDLRLRGSTTAYLDPATTRVLRVDRWRDLPFALRIYHVFAAFHFGEAGGEPLRWLWLIAGLLPLSLWISAWWVSGAAASCTILVAAAVISSGRYAPRIRITLPGHCGVRRATCRPECEVRQPTRKHLQLGPCEFRQTTIRLFHHALSGVER